jgi:GNAT superfamily N-acetyltransferase
MLDFQIDRASFGLRCIAIDEARRGQGAGSRVMNAITRFADEEQLRMSLTPSDAYGGTVERLHEFYRRFGFVENADFTVPDELMREPAPRT